jgi:hypothetical protein
MHRLTVVPLARKGSQANQAPKERRAPKALLENKGQLANVVSKG